MTSGRIVRDSFAEYMAAPGVNHSRLRLLDKSPKHYLHAVAGPASEPTPAMRSGTLVHTMVLEPETRVHVFEGVRRGKAWEAAKEEAEDEPLATVSEYEAAAAMRDAVLAHDDAAAVLASCSHREASVYWEADGRKYKARPDAVSGECEVVDLKTTRDLDAFPAQFARMSYGSQLAWYRHALRQAGIDAAPHALVIAVESVAPHDVAVYEVPAWILDMGAELNASRLAKLDAAERSGVWAGRYPRTTTLELPEWALSSAGIFVDGGEV